MSLKKWLAVFIALCSINGHTAINDDTAKLGFTAYMNVIPCYVVLERTAPTNKALRKPKLPSCTPWITQQSYSDNGSRFTEKSGNVDK
ncbi:MAG: hypothetical protein Q7U18_11610 [Methylobacter sp.]|nr:hypothetical protein [Methylobacter sp.]